MNAVAQSAIARTAAPQTRATADAAAPTGAGAEAPGRDPSPGLVDPATFRAVLGRFVTGVTVVTTRGPDGTVAGVTASSFNAVSMDPPLILWSLALKAPSLSVFRAARYFAVNILAEDQGDVAMRFARPSENKFASLPIEVGIGGVPLIAGALAHLECEVDNRHPGGDHEIMIGRLLRTYAAEREPLVYHRGKFGQFTPA